MIFSLKNPAFRAKSKEIADYYQCISEAHQRFSFENLLVVEDDAELTDAANIKTLVGGLLPNVIETHPQICELKLFYSPKYQGFGIDPQSIVDLTVTPALALMIFSSIAKITGRKKTSLSSTCLIFSSWYLIIVQVLMSVGRQNSIVLLRNMLLPHRISKPAHSGRHEHFALRLIEILELTQDYYRLHCCQSLSSKSPA